MRSEPTFLGLIKRVVGAKVLIEVTSDLPSVSPVIEGRLYRVGQVGSFVRIPVGFQNLFGVVTMVGSAALPESDSALPMPHAQRWLEVQLIGESLGTERFERGISVFPTLDDEVHILTGDYAGVILGRASEASVSVGHHVTADNIRAHVDLNKVVTRHACIVGATGSGKSNSVAVLLSQLTAAAYPGAQIVVVDPHGEYASAFPSSARVFRIGDPDFPLLIPYWAMTFDELASLLVDRRPGSESPQDSALRDKVYALKKKNVKTLKDGALGSEDITAESPVPFDLRQLWYDFDRAERVTYLDNQKKNEALVKEGNPATLTPAEFQPHTTLNTAPYKGSPPVPMGTYVPRLYNRLRDARFDFLLNPGEYDGQRKDLSDLMQDWLGHDRPITVFDLSNAPHEVVDLAIGAISRLLFDVCFWGRALSGVGRDRPILLVYEEAHAYLSKQGVMHGYARRAAQRVLKEGRKYGMGAVVVSQRPSEVDETVLSQCGTFVAMRLTNSADQGQIRTTVPDAMGGLLELLPVLRTGEAIILGEAVEFPYRVKIDLLTNRPDSNDPVIHQRWTQPPAAAEYAHLVTGWRTQRLPKPNP